MTAPVARLSRGHPPVTFIVLAYDLARGCWPPAASVGFPFPICPGAPLLAAPIVRTAPRCLTYRPRSRPDPESQRESQRSRIGRA